MNMNNIFSGVSTEILFIFTAVNYFLSVVLFIMYVSNRIRLNKLKIKYNKFMSGLSGANIEQILENCLDKVHSVSKKNKDIETHINNIERNLLHCIQKVGVVRYNAFDNVGSDLSFSIALLDSSDNGLVISGIYSRDSSYTYAKPVFGGRSKYTLSAEEIQALDIAKKTHREKLYTGSYYTGSDINEEYEK